MRPANEDRPAVVIMAKAPVPGRVKTRLCPPLSFQQAATVAEALLRDTVTAVAEAVCRRRVIALEGETGPWIPTGFEVVTQRGPDLAARLAAAIQSVGGPAVMINADSPQITSDLLNETLERLIAPGADAVLGRAEDGGYWAIGLTRPDARVFDGVPMSTPFTAAAQTRRFAELGLCWDEVPMLRDVDVLADAVEVAAAAPTTHFGRAFRSLNAHELVQSRREDG